MLGRTGSDLLGRLALERCDAAGDADLAAALYVQVCVVNFNRYAEVWAFDKINKTVKPKTQVTEVKREKGEGETNKAQGEKRGKAVKDTHTNPPVR